MEKIQHKNYTKAKKLICGWTDKKIYLIHHRMLKLYVRHGMIVDIIHELISFKQSKWVDKYINFNTQKRNKAKYDFGKDFFILLNNAFHGKSMEKVKKHLRLQFISKNEYKKVIEQQSKLTFNGIHKSYEKCDSYTIKQNEVLMNKPIYLLFAALKLSKLQMNETYYDKLQPFLKQENIQLHYFDTDAFVLSVNTEDIIKDVKDWEDVFDFSNLDKYHEIFTKKKYD